MSDGSERARGEAADPDRPPLFRARGTVLLRGGWTGDAVLDRILAAADPREAAVRAFGARASRRLIRALAGSILGASRPDPGGAERNADLLPLSVALAVDGPSTAPLEPSDLVDILEAGSAGAHAPVSLLTGPQRIALARLVAPWSRRGRRDLGVEVVRTRAGGLRAALDGLVGAVHLLDEFPRPVGLAALLELAHELLTYPDLPPADAPLAGGVAIADVDGARPVDGWQVRVPTTRAQLVETGELFHNCLGGYWSPLHDGVRRIVTIHRHGAPFAVAEINVAGEVVELLGVRNRPLPIGAAQTVRALLARLDLISTEAHDTPVTVDERLAARIACRATLLELAERTLDGGPQRWPAWDELVEAGLRPMLGGRVTVLGDQDRVRWQEAEATEFVHGWRVLGALLVLSGSTDPVLLGLGGDATFRDAARRAADHLRRGWELPGPPTGGQALRVLLSTPGLPPYQHEACTEALAQHPAWE